MRRKIPEFGTSFRNLKSIPSGRIRGTSLLAPAATIKAVAICRCLLKPTRTCLQVPARTIRTFVALQQAALSTLVWRQLGKRAILLTSYNITLTQLAWPVHSEANIQLTPTGDGLWN